MTGDDHVRTRPLPPLASPFRPIPSLVLPPSIRSRNVWYSYFQADLKKRYLFHTCGRKSRPGTYTRRLPPPYWDRSRLKCIRVDKIFTYRQIAMMCLREIAHPPRVRNDETRTPPSRFYVLPCLGEFAWNETGEYGRREVEYVMYTQK